MIIDSNFSWKWVDKLKQINDLTIFIQTTTGIKENQ